MYTQEANERLKPWLQTLETSSLREKDVTYVEGRVAIAETLQ